MVVVGAKEDGWERCECWWRFRCVVDRGDAVWEARFAKVAE